MKAICRQKTAKQIPCLRQKQTGTQSQVLLLIWGEEPEPAAVAMAFPAYPTHDQSPALHLLQLPAQISAMMLSSLCFSQQWKQPGLEKS